jgi:hypothetical protein
MDLKELNKESQKEFPKVVISIKARPELKMHLNKEAAESGMSLSEYGELLLENRHNRETEIPMLESENKALRAQLMRINSQELELVRSENAKLKKQLLELQQNSILKDSRLLQLFENLKGKKDRIINAEGADFDVVYETPIQVLTALIYATKLNQK